MNYEQVIEKARAFVDGSHLGKVTYRELDRAILIIRDMLALFADAHAKEVGMSPERSYFGADSLPFTPADDEREALAKVIHLWDTSESVGSKAWEHLTDGQRTVWREAADFVQSAGFHRTVQGEPSDAQARAEANRRWPHTPADPSAASARSARRLSFRLGVAWARAAAAVQGGETR